jgi:hypothetical protein
MKKMLTFCAMIVGAFSMMVGTSSCKDKEECCEWTDDYGDSYKYCEDDDEVDDFPNGWNYVKAAAALYGGDCD